MVEYGRTSDAKTDRLDQLVRAMMAEASVLDELRETLTGQRESVAQNDQSGVENSIHAMGRIMLTLEECRRQRRSLLALITGGNDVPLADLEVYIGNEMSDELLQARESVQRLAVAAANDLAINQHVLDRVLQAGDSFLQRLFSTALDASPAYCPAGDSDDHSGALLINRTV